MADNTVTNVGSGGDTIATDDLTTLNGGAVSTVKVQRVKVGFGVDAALRDTDDTHGLPINATGTTTSVDIAIAASATSAQVLAANANRKAFQVTNTDVNTCYLYYGTTATATKFAVQLAQNQYWEMNWPIWTGRIDVVWATSPGGGKLVGVELS